MKKLKQHELGQTKSRKMKLMQIPELEAIIVKQIFANLEIYETINLKTQHVIHVVKRRSMLCRNVSAVKFC